MKITILNGDMQQSGSSFSGAMSRLASDLEKNHSVELFNLQSMNLKYCTGCWSCWWKTPGQCAIKDDAELIFRSLIHADFFIFASPLLAGFTTSLLKKLTDRLIVLLHPYLQIINGEHHHRKRYERYPDFGVIVQREPYTDEEDLMIVKDIYDRLAINFHATNHYVKVLDDLKLNEIAYETGHI
jgi:multimeric flavodoxin WrbA